MTGLKVVPQQDLSYSMPNKHMVVRNRVQSCPDDHRIIGDPWYAILADVYSMHDPNVRDWFELVQFVLKIILFYDSRSVRGKGRGLRVARSILKYIYRKYSNMHG